MQYETNKKWFAVPINSGLMHALEHGRTRSYDFPCCMSLVPVYPMLLILLMLLFIFQMQSLGTSDVTCFYRERYACVVT